MRTLLISVLVCHSIGQQVIAQVVPRPAVRVRLNQGIFQQASSIVAGIVEYEVPRIRIPATQQCFSEGCVQVRAIDDLNKSNGQKCVQEKLIETSAGVKDPV
ncbi:hypothetical protein Q1695_003478 [Nippostrongylus brasiliensis]|nr:hypothetical protein Q1695_003478 [Nippostrongylus brasiliensis]